MCGIIGIVGEDKDFIEKSIKLINHRGPEDNGIFISKQVSLGQVRLSIIDLSSKGHQPMFYDNNNLTITFNGEIYNYNEIKHILIKKGHKFVTNSDTEVILASYKEWGENCVKKFRGMWAFCLYDKIKKRLFLSRDKFGKKPLYIYDFKEKFAFSSELKPFMSNSNFNLSISKKDLNHYFAFKYVRPNKSIFNEVFKLKPGHNLVYNLKNKKYSIKQYYKINLNKKYSKKDFNNIFDKEFDRAIKERFVADVPIGAFLSGGVDSSAVVAYMSKYKKNLRTFSIKFDCKGYDESKYAKLVAKKYNIKHKEIKFNSKDIEKIIYDLPYYFDEPLGDSSSIPTFLVSKIAKEDVTVALGGDAADEIFGGYERYWVYKVFSLQKHIPHSFRKFNLKILNSIGKHLNSDFLKKIHRMLIKNKNVEPHLIYGNIFASISDDDFYKLMGEKIDYSSFKPYFNHKFSKNIQLCDLNHYLLEDIFAKVDRASMAHALETRTPFISPEIVELGLNLNNSSKFGFYSGKKCLKKHLEKYLPKEVLYRKKKGFSVPLAQYFRKELKQLVIDKVINYNHHNYLNKKFIKETCENHFSNKKDNSSIIWNILVFNLWYDMWMINERKNIKK